MNRFPIGRADTLRVVKQLPDGGRIVKWIVRYAYPRNGNVHNPTPEWLWERLDAAGQIIYQGSRMRDVNY